MLDGYERDGAPTPVRTDNGDRYEVDKRTHISLQVRGAQGAPFQKYERIEVRDGVLRAALPTEGAMTRQAPLVDIESVRLRTFDKTATYVAVGLLAVASLTAIAALAIKYLDDNDDDEPSRGSSSSEDPYDSLLILCVLAGCLSD